MRTRRRASIENLRLAIECLPTRTKIAMLEGIRTNPIIVGAYSTREGICPMLAAHRAGGRTDLIAFARAWDRFAMGRARRPRTRRATERELLILRSHLEASLLQEEGPLAAAIAEHRALVAARPRGAPAAAAAQAADAAPARHRAGDPDRTRELSCRPGWAWTRLFRRYDDYQRSLERLAGQEHLQDIPRQPAAPHQHTNPTPTNSTPTNSTPTNSRQPTAPRPHAAAR
jgi:hypothetical protein